MIRFLTTTALVAALALPGAVHAQATAGGTTAGWTAVPQEGDIMASHLLGARAFITRTGILESGQTSIDGVPGDWEEIGTVSDILLATGGVPKALLTEVGGFLEVESKLVAVPLQAARMLHDASTEGGEVVLLIESSRQELEDAPVFEGDQVAAAVPGLVRGESGTGEEAEAGEATQAETATDGYTNLTLGELSAEDLDGASVYDAQDQSIGEIAELAVSADGQIERAIIEVGGFLGLGEKRVEVDFDALQVQRDNTGPDIRVYYDTTADDLTEMPEYLGESGD
jgi:hypothetical protein